MSSVNNTYAPHEIMPLTDEQAQALLTGLEQLKGGKVIDKLFGICPNLNMLIDDDVDDYVDVEGFVSTYAQGWEHHSGDDLYPVIGRSHYINTDDLWVGEGGNLRHRLINYLISILEERLYCSKP